MVLAFFRMPMAVEKAAVQQSGTTNQLVIGAQDVIIGSHAGADILPQEISSL